jgi:hypothetical protein
MMWQLNDWTWGPNGGKDDMEQDEYREELVVHIKVKGKKLRRAKKLEGDAQPTSSLREGYET